MSNRYDAFEERLVNLEDKLVALQEQVNIFYNHIDSRHYGNWSVRFQLLFFFYYYIKKNIITFSLPFYAQSLLPLQYNNYDSFLRYFTSYI